MGVLISSGISILKVGLSRAATATYREASNHKYVQIVQKYKWIMLLYTWNKFLLERFIGCKMTESFCWP